MNYARQLQAFLSGLVTTEARVAATVVLTLAAVVTAIVLAPRVVTAAHRTVKYLVFSHERVPVDPPEFDWKLPVTALVRTFQLAVFIATGLAVLVVWGFVDLALAAVTVMASWIPLLVRGLLTIGVVGGTLAGIDMLDTAIEQYAEESDQLNQHQQGIVFRVLQVAVLLGAGIAALSVWGIGLGNLLVGAGFLGIVVGTAARSTIGSLIAGFVLMFARPFEIGDWVEINDDEGIITDITIINTRMRNADGEEVVIPNDNVANATVTNRTSLERLRLSVDVGVDYDADVERAEAIIEEVLGDVKHVLSNPTPQVVPKSLGDSAVVLECRFWIDHPSAAKRAMTTAAVVREVKQALEENGVKIPFPQRELTGRGESGGFQVAQGEAGAARPPAEGIEQSNGQ
ncbi:mechanosensitive ion channel family protein [Haloarcula salinisoli]|uniref:Mechanosensitive ion channel family protein n=1 Tax=Haloarcula salinisoli TaxID=2487746 RepID=A0A8J8C8X2_9EURY|nr:mechanosensitive ion channel family protein [Halomicroarcula salinisoli]MBX0287467.1 mechanosensitive ion channel family protein [Halomicroarcula salinisoli]MBX0304961.1 mechanosensitive ion channel family protein [Halomicroarcula salinisoli]